MNKINLGVIFGGMSTEHDVSIVSGTSIIRSLRKDKYNVVPIYIDKSGNWYKYNGKIEDIKEYKVGEEFENIEVIDNTNEYLKNLDVIFPVLHGLYGEDGTIQGLFELLKIPYVGCRVLASSVGMDKVYTKIVFEKAGIAQVPYVYIRKNKDKYIYVDEILNEEILEIEQVCAKVKDSIEYPMFVKPSNSGSSVGIKKAENELELKEAIEYASQYDKKILIEQGVNAREIECAVLGNEDVKSSIVGEVLSAEDFYTFDAKYKNSNSRTQIPAQISDELQEEIRKNAIKAFKAIDGKGLARVDFFVENDTNKIYINEINTLPGFTQISMYPKMWEKSGLKYSDLLDELIKLAIEENN